VSDSPDPRPAKTPQTGQVDPVAGGERTGPATGASLVALLDIGIVFAPAVIALIALRSIDSPNPLVSMGVIWLANVIMLGLVWVSTRRRGQSYRSIGLNFGRVGLGTIFRTILSSLAIAVFAIAAFVAGSMVMPGGAEGADAADMTRYNYLQGNLPMLLVTLAGVYVVSSFGEEVIYRGFLITRLEQAFGSDSSGSAIFALLSSSAIFGLAHFEWGAAGVVQATFMGLAMGTSFYLTRRSLWPLILAHVYLDTLLLVPLYLAPVASAGV
jgi:membrane protease YdiL (CAAX protease family)